MKVVKTIVSKFGRSVKPHPRRYYQWQAAPEGIDNILSANLAAGRFVWGW